MKDPIVPRQGEAAEVRQVQRRHKLISEGAQQTLDYWDRIRREYRAECDAKLAGLSGKEYKAKKRELFKDAIQDMPSSKRLAEIEEEERLQREADARHKKEAGYLDKPPGTEPKQEWTLWLKLQHLLLTGHWIRSEPSGEASVPPEVGTAPTE